jgi:hypothetical protein
VAGGTSYWHYQLVEDVNRGGVTIVPHLQDPIPINLIGAVDQLTSTGSMTVTADTGDAVVDGYRWYLNGEEVGTEDSVVVGPGLDPGFHWLDVVVTAGSVLSSERARFEVVDQQLVDLTGHWALFDIFEGEEGGPGLVYILQTGTDLDSNVGGMDFTGTTDGSAVTFWWDEDGEHFELAATIGSDGIIRGDISPGGGSLRIEPFQPSYGTLDMSGYLNFHSDLALGNGGGQVSAELRFWVEAHPFSHEILFTDNRLGPDTYEIGPAHTSAIVFVGDEELDAQSGFLILDEFGPDGTSGSFRIAYENGDFLEGTFDLDLPPDGEGLVTVTDGLWLGTPVSVGTVAGIPWNTSPHSNPSEQTIVHVDEDRMIGVVVEHSQKQEITAGVFAVPDEYEVDVIWYAEDGTEMEDDAISGELVITSYDRKVGVSGYFLDMRFPGGLLSASFDVKNELNEFRY